VRGKRKEKQKKEGGKEKEKNVFIGCVTLDFCVTGGSGGRSPQKFIFRRENYWVEKLPKGGIF
jgi:hypothetical protein